MSEHVRCALWMNDLRRIRLPQRWSGDYVPVEVLADRLAGQLARSAGIDEHVVRERLERGCRAFAAWSWADEEIASWLWVSTGEEHAWPLRRMLRIPDGDCHGWDAGTLPDHRGLGLCCALLDQASWRMGREGCCAMWNGILDANLVSQRAHARAGFRPVLRLLAVHEPPPGQLQTWAADYADVRLVARARRMLEAPAVVTDSAGIAGGRDR